MIKTRLPLDALAIGSMVAVCAVLGIQQVALKSVAQDMSPVSQLAIRSDIAAVLLGSTGNQLLKQLAR